MIALAAPGTVARLRPPPLVQRLAQAGAATLLVNGFNFALALLLVRVLAPRAFGLWATLTTLQGVAGVFLTALVAQQMAYTLPRLRHPARQRAMARVFNNAALWCVGGFVPVTAATLFMLDVPWSVVVTGSAFVAATGMRNHARFHLFALRRARAVLARDAVFVALAGGGVAVSAVSHWRGGLPILLLALTLANVTAAMGIWFRPARAVTPARMRRHLAAYRRHAPRAWWSLVTVGLSTLSALSPNLALASTGSLAALATVAAPAALLAPLRLMALTFQSSLRAEFSALIGAGRRQAALQLHAAASALALLACVMLGVMLWTAWSWLGPRVFARGYDPALLRTATLLTFAVAAVNVVRLPGAVLLNAAGVFRFSAATLALVVPVVLMLAWWLAHAGHVAAVLCPALLGELALFGAELVALQRWMR